MSRGPKPGGAGPRKAMETAMAAWDIFVPEWVEELAIACDRTSQNVVAKRIGYSASVVSTVLRKTYIGSYETVEKSVRGALMGETLTCPVAGVITKSVCLGHQKLAAHFSSASSFRIRMSKACKGGCPHSRIGAPHA